MTEVERTAPVTSSPPGFGRSLRGYDPDQVDAFVSELSARLAQAQAAIETFGTRHAKLEVELQRLRSKLHEVESRPPIGMQQDRDSLGSDMERIGEEVARVLESASEASMGIRRRADESAAAAVEAASVEAARIVEDTRNAVAREEGAARAVRDAAAAEATRLLDAAYEESKLIVAAAEGEAEQRVMRGQVTSEAMLTAARQTRRASLSGLEDLRRELDEQLAATTARQRDLQADLARLDEFLRGI
jgi:DivIVA domain-containing protein